MARRRDKDEERAIALKRMDQLLQLAELEARGNEPERADRYAQLAAKVASKYQTGLAPRHKLRICRACHAFLVPGRTSRVRLVKGRLTTTCLRCGAVRRMPVARERGAGTLKRSAAKPAPQT